MCRIGTVKHAVAAAAAAADRVLPQLRLTLSCLPHLHSHGVASLLPCGAAAPPGPRLGRRRLLATAIMVQPLRPHHLDLQARDPLDVFEYQGRLYSLSNRRLYLFRCLLLNTPCSTRQRDDGASVRLAQAQALPASAPSQCAQRHPDTSLSSLAFGAATHAAAPLFHYDRTLSWRFLDWFCFSWFYDFDTFCLDLCPAWRLEELGAGRFRLTCRVGQPWSVLMNT